ncbi:MAG: FG-GAP-like repeat-containing protein [Pyrinomonadaceae bacterium]
MRQFRGGTIYLAGLFVVVALLFLEIDFRGDPVSASLTGGPSTEVPLGGGLPLLGSYPNTSVATGDNITITPDAAPTDTTRITVSAPTSFIGELDADAATGIVRVTNAAHANTTPATYEITVTAHGPGGTASANFDLTVTDPPPCTELEFSPAVTYATDRFPNNVVIGDFNGDGVQDLVTINAQFGTASILLGNGDGTFAAAVNYSVASDPFSIAVGDLNGDGVQDLAVAREQSAVLILIGIGDGTFAPYVSYSAPSRPVSVAIADLDGDGDNDLATANVNSDDVSFLPGNGDGTFGAAVKFPAGDAPGSIVIGDFNGDGDHDLATTNLTSQDISILLGNGNGTFAPATNLPVGAILDELVLGDLNADGVQDLAAVDSDGDTAAVMIGNGDGTFAAPVNYGVGESPESVSIGDLNGDGFQDLVTANFDTDDVSILLGSGDGTFATAVHFVAGDRLRDVAIGDFDGDGDQDLVTANWGAHNVSILRRNCDTVPTPTPTSTPTATPTASPTATPTPTPTGFENDVTPRANGDGIVISGDVIQMRRFATGLDTPALDPNEYQRADSAPRATFGDGIVNSGDVIQARRYATGLDPATPAAGPTGPPISPNVISEFVSDVYNYFFGRTLTIGPIENNGRAVVVPIELVPHGDEVAVSFTLEYDSSRYGTPQVTLADGAPAGAVLTVNDTQKGRIGILIDSIEAFEASAVPRRFVQVEFRSTTKVGELDPLFSLTGSSAPISISDAQGKAIVGRQLIRP